MRTFTRRRFAYIHPRCERLSNFCRHYSLVTFVFLLHLVKKIHAAILRNFAKRRALNSGSNDLSNFPAESSFSSLLVRSMWDAVERAITKQLFLMNNIEYNFCCPVDFRENRVWRYQPSFQENFARLRRVLWKINSRILSY